MITVEETFIIERLLTLDFLLRFLDPSVLKFDDVLLEIVLHLTRKFISAAIPPNAEC